MGANEQEIRDFFGVVGFQHGAALSLVRLDARKHEQEERQRPQSGNAQRVEAEPRDGLVPRQLRPSKESLHVRKLGTGDQSNLSNIEQTPRYSKGRAGWIGDHTSLRWHRDEQFLGPVFSVRFPTSPKSFPSMRTLVAEGSLELRDRRRGE